MKILMSGTSGLVGRALCEALSDRGDVVIPLVRDDREGLRWDPPTYALSNPDALNEMDAVVHLAGESIVGRWSEAKKQAIRDSRVKSTAALANALVAGKRKPKAFIVASAIGWYGSRGKEELTEDIISGSGFLADVVKEWEAAADPAREAGIRVVHLRFGMILSTQGGALKTMLPPFKWGVGGKIGSGRQFVSWVSIQDAVRACVFALDKPNVDGALNVVAPTATTNLDLTKALGQACSRPTFFPVPVFAARLVFGEMADALLLASQKVVPKRLLDAGFIFEHVDLVAALKNLLATGK